jgi:hypothetical protein
VYDGARLALYLDGKLDAQAAATGTPDANDEALQIGAAGAPAPFMV